MGSTDVTGAAHTAAGLRLIGLISVARDNSINKLPNNNLLMISNFVLSI